MFSFLLSHYQHLCDVVAAAPHIQQKPILALGPLAVAGIMAAAGALQSKMANDRAQQVEDSDRKLAADTERYSPWTHMQAQPIRSAGSQGAQILGGAAGGGLTGYMLGNAMQNATPTAGPTPTPSGGMGNYSGANTNIMTPMGSGQQPFMGEGGASSPWASPQMKPTLMGGANPYVAQNRPMGPYGY